MNMQARIAALASAIGADIKALKAASSGGGVTTVALPFTPSNGIESDIPLKATSGFSFLFVTSDGVGHDVPTITE